MKVQNMGWENNVNVYEQKTKNERVNVNYVQMEEQETKSNLVVVTVNNWSQGK